MGIEVFQPELSCEAQEECQPLPFSGKDQVMTDISFSGGGKQRLLRICFVFIDILL